jgi:hypothetical protein
MNVHRQTIPASFSHTAVAWVAGILLWAASAQAAVLTTVPMQGGMLMPVVSYHADSGRVTVDLSHIGVVAQLTPLLVSNPKDNFESAAPWFACLDPSRQGLAFSRRYGFDMDPNTDLLPDNCQLWIRKTAGSNNLAIYDYNASSSPRRWTPIFGTAGSTNATYWSGLMWHVGVAAPPGTNQYSATFEVYVVNTTTGLEVPGSSSGAFDLSWTTVPDGRPPLRIAPNPGGGTVISWPGTSADWTLVSSTNLASSDWVPVSEPAVPANGQFTVYIESGSLQKFYRLQRNP